MGRTERVEPRVGGLRWHAMRVGCLLRSTEGVGAESHRVTGSQGRRYEESRGVAESIAAHIAAHIAQTKQGGWWRRGTNGAARLTRADTTCDETMVAWRASRRQAWRRQAWRRQAWREAQWAREVDAAAHRRCGFCRRVLSLSPAGMSSEAVPKNANKYQCTN